MQHQAQLVPLQSGMDAHRLRPSPLMRRGPPQSPLTHHHAYGQHMEYAPLPMPHSRKRSRPRNDLQIDLGLPGLHGMEHHDDLHVELSPHSHHVQPQSSMYSHHGHQPTSASMSQGMQQQQHHHHRLPNQPPPNKMRRMGYDSPPPQHHGPPSVVGQEGMPPPAPRPRGPKLKFTPDDDQLLVDLKEKKNLTWKQIADFFPGRSSGTLQVRYCTKLKAKTTIWTEELVQKLRNALKEYENDKWRIISTKVGSGFSPTACKDKVQELETGIPVDSIGDSLGDNIEERDTSSNPFDQSVQEESASSDVMPTYS